MAAPPRAVAELRSAVRPGLRASPQPLPALPVEREGARIVAIKGLEAFTVYLPQPGNPVFMTLIEKTFGKDVTTRTWDTVRKCAQA